MAGATISLKNQKSGRTLVVHSDSRGHYFFKSLPLGNYDLLARMPGYREPGIRPVSLVENQKARIDFLVEKEVANRPQKNPLGQMEYSDQLEFTVAGVTDPTNLGGHGSDVILRTKEELAKEAVSLSRDSPRPIKPVDSAPIATSKSIRAQLARDDRADLHETLADIEERDGHPLEAVREYQKAAEMEPKEAYFFAWGAELLLHRAPEPAVEVFAKGNHLFPGSVRMMQGLGVAYYARGSYEQAIDQLLQACDLDPADPNSYTFLAKIQSTEKVEIPGWTVRLKKLIGLQPENALAYYYYAVALFKQSKQERNFEQVESLLREAIKLDPRLGEAYLQLGILNAERKEFPPAIAYFQKAIETTSLPEEAHFRLAQVYRQTGETQKSREEIELYEQISRQKAKAAEADRHEIPQFVYTLKGQPSPAQPPPSTPH
ncbi:MAG: tetratricopeptide repeat protein [Candidatus Acidiferrales bacterium]